MPEDSDKPQPTDEQIRAALRSVGEDARREAFAAGLPVYILKGRFLVALHADGTEEVIEELDLDAEAGHV